MGALAAWLRARDVLAGEDAVKRAGEKYLPRLEAHTPNDYLAYVARASFFNATARVADNFVGMIFRRVPFVKVPEGSAGAAGALHVFVNDMDMYGTSLGDYAKRIVREVVSVGRAGTLVDWEGQSEKRAYASVYCAEDILNWREERLNGRNVLSLLVLREMVRRSDVVDDFDSRFVEQLRVLRLVRSEPAADWPWFCQVEVWRKVEKKDGGVGEEWKMMSCVSPLRRGAPLPLIPFVFHGPRGFLAGVDKPPLEDVISVNLDHYRLSADYNHGMHFTALPTAWVAGFDKDASLKIGSSTAWTTDVVGATAGFLEFRGQGLETFERAMDRDERLMAILGARLLETQKRVAETFPAVEQRQSGEHCVLGSIANSVSAGLTFVLRWVYWWNSAVVWPEDVTKDEVCVELNTDFRVRGLQASEIVALVQAWQGGALSHESLLDLFRRGEVLADARTNEEELASLRRYAMPAGAAIVGGGGFGSGGAVGKG